MVDFELCCHGNLKQNQENFTLHPQVTKKLSDTKCLSHVVLFQQIKNDLCNAGK